MLDYIHLFAGPGGSSLGAERLGLTGLGNAVPPMLSQLLLAQVV